ncbi:MAG TPA: MFS transporter, partial [Candidatus Limnocylindrales bacterium]|nr:MFS transporter [Candidatus Limnocylindrales bacterium]
MPAVAAAPRPTIYPNRTLWLLSIAHAVNHAQAVLLPLVYVRIIAEFGVSAGTIAILAAAGSLASGLVQLSYAKLTRVISRRKLLAAGGVLFGGGFAAQALAPNFASFALVNVVSRVGGSPQHPVGNGLLAEQFPEERRGFAISAHISGGNVGTVVVAVAGAAMIANLGWKETVVAFGIPAVVIALGILLFVRESGEDQAAAVAHGTLREAFGTILRDPDHRWIYLTSVLGGGGRGLGVVNLFALLYLTRVLGLPAETTDVMYGVFIVFSVPMPLVAGWLSDRIGRKPV